MISASGSFNILVIRWALTWIHRTVRIPCLTVVDPDRKVSNLYFKVVDPKLQVADLKAEVGELRSGGIPQFNPWMLCRLMHHMQLNAFGSWRRCWKDCWFSQSVSCTRCSCSLLFESYKQLFSCRRVFSVLVHLQLRHHEHYWNVSYYFMHYTSVYRYATLLWDLQQLAAIVRAPQL